MKQKDQSQLSKLIKDARSITKNQNQPFALFTYTLVGKNIHATDVLKVFKQISKDHEQSNQPTKNSIFLPSNPLGDIGCRNLSKIDLPNLITLNLKLCNIGNHGCYHLSKAQFSWLQELSLPMNYIAEKGCEHLSKIQTNSLAYLGSNPIGKNGFHCLVGRFTQLVVDHDYQDED